MSETLNYLKVVSRSNGVTSNKERQIRNLKRRITKDFVKSIDAENVVINGEEKILLITRDKGDEQIKKIKSLPDDNFELGDVVMWNDIPYIVYKVDADRRIQTKGRMYECNTKLRWKNKSGKIIERFGKGEDATKYSEGTQGGYTLRVGEFQLKVIVTLDEETVLIRRDDRFMIDTERFLHVLSENEVLPMVYRVTRRNVVTGTFQDKGYVEITMVEDQFISGHDDPENMLACRRSELIETGSDDCENTFSTTEETADEGGWL